LDRHTDDVVIGIWVANWIWNGGYFGGVLCHAVYPDDDIWWGRRSFCLATEWV